MEEEFREIFSSVGIKNCSQKDLRRIIWAWWKPYIQNAQARKGASKLLEFLKRMKLKLGIVAKRLG